MDEKNHTLLYLLRLALGTSDVSDNLSSLSAADWELMVKLSFKQGVAAIALDGLQKIVQSNLEIGLALDSEPLENLKYKWYGYLFQTEDQYMQYVDAIKSLADAYSGKGIETMVLKGYGLSLNYPVPSHRPIGDIDVYLSDWKRGDEMIANMGIKIDYSHHHHSVFKWKGQLVENHYDIENRYASRSGRASDDLLKQLALDGRNQVEGLYFPSATFNGIFLTSHAAAHFSGDNITLRHLLDWALFVDKNCEEIDWLYVEDVLRSLGLIGFFNCMNALSIDYLGIPAEKFPHFERNSTLESRVIEDIFNPAFKERGRGLLFKLKRLKANMWKRNLVNSEPLIPRMVRLAWSHMIKPQSRL